jgi:hypothetical protein
MRRGERRIRRTKRDGKEEEQQPWLQRVAVDGRRSRLIFFIKQRVEQYRAPSLVIPEGWRGV